MEFFTDGSLFTFTVNSGWGALVIFYLIFEVVFLISTKMSLTHKLLIIPRIIIQLRKQTPKHWKIGNVFNMLLMTKYSKFRYEFYMEFRCILKVKKLDHSTPILINPLFTNDEIIVNFWGKIIKSRFKYLINQKDKFFLDDVKQFKREQSLKDLGI